MDLTVKIIPVFFLLILLANYFNFVGFFYIMRNLPCTQGRVLRRKTKAYFGIMNCLYALVVGLSFVPGLRPLCTDEKVYPYVMNLASCLFVVNYLFHWLINCNKEYFMRDKMVDQELLSNGITVDPLDDLDEQPLERKLDWYCKEES